MTSPFGVKMCYKSCFCSLKMSKFLLPTSSCCLLIYQAIADPSSHFDVSLLFEFAVCAIVSRMLVASVSSMAFASWLFSQSAFFSVFIKTQWSRNDYSINYMLADWFVIVGFFKSSFTFLRHFYHLLFNCLCFPTFIIEKPPEMSSELSTSKDVLSCTRLAPVSCLLWITQWLF